MTTLLRERTTHVEETEGQVERLREEISKLESELASERAKREQEAKDAMNSDNGTVSSREVQELRKYNEGLMVRRGIALVALVGTPWLESDACTPCLMFVPAATQKMLKCSSCSTRFKSHLIARCSHLFCKECLDTRLETRQRKCPTCGIAFGAQDVSQVYF